MVIGEGRKKRNRKRRRRRRRERERERERRHARRVTGWSKEIQRYGVTMEKKEE